MNKKGGFTLIELLAVIVILAIIAVIAVPIVLNIIDETKNNATLRSAEMYSKAINNSLATKMLSGKKIENGSYLITNDGNICLGEYNNNSCEGEVLEIEVTGIKPTEGWIAIDEGNVVYTNLTINNKDYSSIPYTDDSNFIEVEPYGNDKVEYEFSDGTPAESEGDHRAIIDEDKCIEVFSQYDDTNAIYPIDYICKSEEPRSGFPGYVYESGFASSIGYEGSIYDDGIVLLEEYATIKKYHELKSIYKEKTIVVPKKIDNKIANFKMPILVKAPNEYLNLYKEKFKEERIIIDNNTFSYRKGFIIDAARYGGLAIMDESILPNNLISEVNQYVVDFNAKFNILDGSCLSGYEYGEGNEDEYRKGLLTITQKYTGYLNPITDALMKKDEYLYGFDLNEPDMNGCIDAIFIEQNDEGYSYRLTSYIG